MLGTAISGVAAPASAQAIEPRSPVESTVLGGRINFQLNSTSADSVGIPAAELFLRRARIWVATRVTDWIDAAVQIDVAGKEATARYAFIRFTFTEHTRLSIGQFKRAFDLFELTSSSQTLVIERDGNIRGVRPCTGIGGVCSYSRFSEKLSLASLDVGALLQGETDGGHFGYMLMVANGAGPNVREENDAKSVSGRVEWSPRSRLRIGANFGMHDYPNEVTGVDDYARASALDVEWGDFEGGPHVQVGVLTGQNWRNLDAGGEASRFRAFQVIGSYRTELDGPGRVEAIEPIARVSWGDPDRGTLRDAGLLFTPGFVLHFSGRNKVAANVDVWRPQADDVVWGFKLQSYVYF